MKKKLLLLILLVNILQLNAKISKVDSLEQCLAKHEAMDTLKVNYLNYISFAVNASDPEKCISYALLADSLSDGLDYMKGKAASLNNQGIFYYRKGKYEKAIACYQAAIEISREAGLGKTLFNYIGNLGVIYMYQGMYAPALDCFNQKLASDLSYQDTTELCVCYNNIGIVYHYQGNYPKALEYYHKSLELSEKRHDASQLCTAYQNIGIVYKALDQDSLALEYYQKGRRYYEEINSIYGMVSSSLSIGVLYSRMHDYSKALENYQQTLAISTEHNYGLMKCMAIGNIGDVYKAQGDYDRALEYKKKALKLATQIGSKDYIASNNMDLSTYYYNLENYSKALDHGKKAYAIALEIGALKRVRDASEILAKVYAALGDYEQAYAYYVVFKEQSDSLFNDSNVKEITNLENQYAFDKEKEALAADQALKDIEQRAELKRQKMIRNSFIAGFLLILLFATFVFRSLAQNRKANRQLRHQKAEIEKQADELKMAHSKLLELNQFKEGMTSMIVHDLKNPLNGIINSSRTFSLEHQLLYMRQVGRQMLTMVLNILDVNKYENSVMKLDKLQISLLEVAQSAVDEIAFLAEQKNISINNEIDSSVSVLAEKNIIQRIFVNLLSNAIKYTPNNGQVFIAAVPFSDKVKVTVQDSGEGIPADKLQLVFAKFKQIDAKDSGRIRSTGLGLTFCKMAVEAHGGSIQALSDINQGATFEFTLEAGSVLTSSVDSRSPIQVAQALELTADDKRVLAPFVALLKEIEIYKLFEVRKIIRTIDEKDNVNIQRWKEDVLNAVVSGNKEKYTQLLVL